MLAWLAKALELEKRNAGISGDLFNLVGFPVGYVVLYFCGL